MNIIQKLIIHLVIKMKDQIITRLAQSFIESGGDPDALDEFIRSSVDFDVTINTQNFDNYVTYNFTFNEKIGDTKIASISIMKPDHGEI